MMSHAFVIEAEAEEGIGAAQAWAERELGMKVQTNPDVVVLRYGLLSVEDARRIFEVVSGAPFAGEHKVIIIAANRAYHEAQNALLKIFEEPPPGTHIFLVMPSLGGLLPTLRSRVQEISLSSAGRPNIGMSKTVEEFIEASKEKRSAMIKKIATHQEGGAVSAREDAIAILNGVERAAYEKYGFTKPVFSELLADVAILRGHLYDRSAPVKMILEHLSLIIPKGLV